MATSLAEQLQRLAVPQTQVLQRTKKRASLIFDAKEATKYDTDTLYQIGCDGLADLILKDNHFEEFQDSLFHYTSKTFERAVENIEANQKLNKTIRRFLFLLLPQLSHYSSQKALEWLIYRYHINTFNKEDLLMVILPYHEVDIFVKVLQLLDVKSPNDSKWNWLRPLQKSKIHLPKQTLFRHAASDSSFLEFISNFMINIIKEYEKPESLVVVYNFYCTTFVAAIEYSEKVNEIQVSHMQRVISLGLVSNIPDFVAASYIITAKLLTKVQLSEKILNHFMEKIVQMKAAKLKMEAYLTIAVLYKSQKHFCEISDAAYNTLSKKDLPKFLRALIEDECDIFHFIKVLMKHSLECILQNKDDGSAHFLDELFNEIKLKNDEVEELLTEILDLYSKTSKINKNSYLPWLKDFIRTIERQYSNAFDVVFKRILSPNASKTQQRALRELVNNFSVMESSYELFGKLYHPNSSMRIEGLNIMKTNFNAIREKDVDTLQNFLTDILNDDNVEVVETALNLFRSEFVSVFNAETLCSVMVKLLSTYPKEEKSWEVTYITLDIVCKHFTDSNVAVVLAILPYLLPTSNFELKAARQILKSNFGVKSYLLKSSLKELNQATNPIQFCELVQAAIAKNGNFSLIETLLQVIKQVPKESQTGLHKQMVVILLSTCLPENSPAEITALVLDIFEMYLQASRLSVIKGELKSLDYLIKAKNDKFTIQGFLLGIKNLIVKTEKQKINFGCFDFCSTEELPKLYIRLLKMLLEGCCGKKTRSSIFSDTLNVFFQHFCGDNLILITELLLNVSIAENELIDDSLRHFCIKIVKELIQKDKSIVEQFIQFEFLTVPYILVCLNAESIEIRELSLQLLTIITDVCSSKGDNYLKFLKKLIKYQDEIRLDYDQVPTMIFNVFSENEIWTRTLSELIKIPLDSSNPTYLQAGIVTLLSLIDDLNIYEQFSKLSLEILGKHNTENELTISESTIIYRNLLRFNSKFASSLEVGNSIWNLIKQSILNDKAILKYQCKTTCPSVFILEQIDRELFSNLNLGVKTIFLDAIIEIATNTKRVEVINAVGHIFKKIDLDASLVKTQLECMRDVKSKEAEEKRKRVVIPTIDILETNEWKKGITILEFIQDKKKFTNTVVLLPIMFRILKKCLDFDEQASLEYAKQLLLSAILHCCNKMEVDQSLPEHAFDMQSVVQCIRASQNPQTHHHALVLLAHTASLIPKQIMHNIITIFTFVGSSVLRHDDVYSFQIMTKIIDTIIPILIQGGSKENICNILRVFVDAILDVPEHRRMPLFVHLLTCLNPEENLHMFLIIIFEAQLFHGHEEKQKTNKDRLLVNVEHVQKRLTITTDLLKEFPIQTIVSTFIKILHYLKTFLETTTSECKIESYLFNVNCLQKNSEKRETQFRHYKYIILTFLLSFLKSPQFINKIAPIPDSELLEMQDLFKNFLLKNLEEIGVTSQIAQYHMKKNTNHVKYWKAMLHESYEILDAFNALLPPQMFVTVIRGLINYSLSMVKKKAFELLNNKLQHNPEYFQNCDNDKLYNVLVISVVNIIKGSNESELDSDQEVIMQKALISLKFFSKMLATSFPEEFVDILDYLAILSKNYGGKFNENVMASLILCIAELCGSLKARAIPCLSKFMPNLLKLLKSQKNVITSSEQQKNQTTQYILLISTVTAIHKILDCLALFMSPYIEKILYEISSLSCKFNECEEKIARKLTNMQEKLGSSISMTVLLPALENCYNKLISKANYSAVAPLLNVLSESFNHLLGVDIQVNLHELTDFFLNALQFRSGGSCTHEEANKVEECIIKSLMVLTLKLSESNFRPLYCQLYDWAIHSDEKSERVITFYNLSYCFANSLKGIFSLFAPQFLNNAVKLLDECNTSKTKELFFKDEEKNISLLEYILKTLHTVFLFDNHKFVNKTRFKILMQPIVDQLENFVGGEDALQERALNILIPCIVQFAVSTADDSLWKESNYQILLKTKHESSKIRLVSLHCLLETAKKLGEDFLILMPESVPFLAELLEDDEEEVQKSCKKMLQELEKVVGSSLQEYF